MATVVAGVVFGRDVVVEAVFAGEAVLPGDVAAAARVVVVEDAAVRCAAVSADVVGAGSAAPVTTVVATLALRDGRESRPPAR